MAERPRSFLNANVAGVADGTEPDVTERDIVGITLVLCRGFIDRIIHDLCCLMVLICQLERIRALGRFLKERTESFSASDEVALLFAVECKFAGECGALKEFSCVLEVP